MHDPFLANLEAELPQLRRYARALTRNAENADDLTQECLERAIIRRKLFEEGSNLRSWLFTIMHNLHIDQWRKERRRGNKVSLEEWHAESAIAPTQYAAAELNAVHSAIRTLNTQEREVLVLVGLNGWKYRETADHLQIAVGTVKSRLSRARLHLRELLGEPEKRYQ